MGQDIFSLSLLVQVFFLFRMALQEFVFQNPPPSKVKWSTPNYCMDLFYQLQVILDKIEYHGIENNIIGDLNCDMSAYVADNYTYTTSS